MQRILFSRKDFIRRAARRQLDRRRYAFDMMDFDEARLDAYAAVIPITQQDQDHLQDLRSAGIATRSILPPPKATALCRDKLAFMLHLIEAGLGDLLPALLPEAATAPFVLKPRVGEFGRDARVVTADTVACAPLPGPAEGFLKQEYVAGSAEFATHLLMAAGRPVFEFTVEYDMGPAPYVRNADTRGRLAGTAAHTPYLDDFLRLLDAVGFDTGTCCLDYKVRDGRPLVFEVNPRFGGSLSNDLAGYVEAYLGTLGASGPPSS